MRSLSAQDKLRPVQAHQSGSVHLEHGALVQKNRTAGEAAQLETVVDVHLAEFGSWGISRQASLIQRAAHNLEGSSLMAAIAHLVTGRANPAIRGGGYKVLFATFTNHDGFRISFNSPAAWWA